ncbi:MAG: class III signal peptide-containing protein [Bdellovibrionales bacterium]|nr:class III signal peptide-containing protein [Bdellovibrionales bacterium]
MANKNMLKKLKKRGQTSVEYILIIAVIVGVILAFGKQFRTRIEGVTNELFGGVSKGIEGLTK